MQCAAGVGEEGDEEITAELALEDYLLPEAKQQDLMYCYCKSLFWTALSNGDNIQSAMSEKFDDGENHCMDWLEAYSLQKAAVYTTPLAIIFVTAVAKTILRLMTRLEGHQSKPEEVYASAVNMWLMAFINSGITIQIVYFDIFGSDVPLLLNEYDEFTQEWYS